MIKGSKKSVQVKGIDSRLVPPAGFEPAPLVPETSALSPELRGPLAPIVATAAPPSGPLL